MGSAHEPRRLAKVLASAIGRSQAARRWRGLVAILAIFVLAGYLGFVTYRQSEVDAQRAREVALAAQAAERARQAAEVEAKREAVQKVETEQAKLKADYAANRGKLLSDMRAAVKRGDPWHAESIGQPYLSYADPQFTKQYEAAVAAEDEQRAREEAKEQREVLAARRRLGVEIGMTEERVLQSSWGKPDHVNRTTTANGVREQWVYDSRGSGYLYFDDGILTGIQN